jgi:hypothetical protein
LGVKGFGGVFKSRSKFSSSRDNFLANERIPQQVLMDLYATAGEFVIQWGLFEAQIVTTINLVYFEFGGKELDPILPRGFGRRMKFLKICFNRIPALEAYKLEMREIRSGAKRLVIIRDFFAHGFFVGFDPKTEVYRIKSLDNNEDDTMHVEDTFDFTLKSIGRSCQRVSELFFAAHSINDRLMG